ncbi:hypothetical protein BCCH1_63670 [Burkholderia contaminans]|uniref:Uncharacterized protein n=1 Tax=Burkholderia contaminans TaxID=488447 RepID=A0A250LGZ5_9BURK|nr:hypothetical protein BCCH1_63670 [Burkholderia contaminans]GLZ74626.1 hypothetical protein Bcon01_76710 [Burkholderia contaminans]
MPRARQRRETERRVEWLALAGIKAPRSLRHNGAFLVPSFEKCLEIGGRTGKEPHIVARHDYKLSVGRPRAQGG